MNFNAKHPTTKVVIMKAEYDLSKLKSRKNPYASKLKKSVSAWVAPTTHRNSRMSSLNVLTCTLATS